MLIEGGPFGCVMADPPWSFMTWSKTRQTRAAENHYSTMTFESICAVPLADYCAKDTVLFLWAIDTMLDKALYVINAWGFTYKTVGFYWAKTGKTPGSFPMKMGYWTRANPEQCLLATCGKPQRLARNVKRLIEAPAREHSRKPDEAYSRAQRLVAGPYLDLFSRESRPGWTSWGFEAGKFDRG